VTAGVIFLVLCAPLFAAIFVLVKTSSRGRAIFRQKRLGKSGRTFVLYKFRSTKHTPADAERQVWGRADDPRCTAVGRVLRVLGLDELPQLMNVLTGAEMRHIALRLCMRIPGWAERHAARPGMTGLAQMKGFRGNTRLPERLKYDVEYVSRCSLRLDLFILLVTVSVFIRKCAGELANGLFRKRWNGLPRIKRDEMAAGREHQRESEHQGVSRAAERS